MRKLVLVSLILCGMIVSGCRCEDCRSQGHPSYVIPSVHEGSGGFNGENYVWEAFDFSTNRVQTIQR